jgi:acetyl-CoA carboxylase carboxyl transferase subunit alpha
MWVQTTAMNYPAAFLWQLCGHIISEADGGAHNDPQLTAENISDYIEGALKRKLQKGLDELLEGRYNKFRTVGEFEESSQE